MAGLVVVISGTYATVPAGGELTVNTTTPGAAGVYSYTVDFSNLAASESCFCRLYKVVLASGPSERVSSCTIIGVSSHPVKDTIPVAVDTGSGITLILTIQQNNGSTRNLPWKLFQLE